MSKIREDSVPAFISRKSSDLKLEARNMDGVDVDEEDEIELSLGLSLNGQFGFDPKRENRLSRSSSIPAFMTAESNRVAEVKSLTPAHESLARTYSVPTVSEEWRKRKLLQSLRRLEARRKRLEKLKNPKTGRDLEDGEVSGKKRPVPIFRQLSIGSSGISESDHLPPQGRTAANMKVAESTVLQMEKNNGGSKMENGKAKEMLKNVLMDMPYVTTTGGGADGKRIEGFLYHYGRGEEAKIVCVCHGNFLSPSEFVRHAGGGDVSHPLKHIIVSPSPLV